MLLRWVLAWFGNVQWLGSDAFARQKSRIALLAMETCSVLGWAVVLTAATVREVAAVCMRADGSLPYYSFETAYA